MHLISLAALVIAASPPQVATSFDAVPRPAIVAQTSTANVARRRSSEPAGTVFQSSTTSDDDAALAQQRELHVMMPALSGDGGG